MNTQHKLNGEMWTLVLRNMSKWPTERVRMFRSSAASQIEHPQNGETAKFMLDACDHILRERGGHA